MRYQDPHLIVSCGIEISLLLTAMSAYSDLA